MNVPVQHIEIVDNQPVVGAKRVKVKMVVNMVVRGRATLDDVVEQYNLSPAEVHAALAYYYDNQAEFDRQHSEDMALLEQVGKPADEHLAQLRQFQKRPKP
ncbi:MAG: DUF433 domain-containing protein [Chloroflexi bacterium]|nr:DUF433 domain-containing protein [Chloroflexota bacterium]